MPSEIVNYFTNHIKNFTVCGKELQKTSREKRFYRTSEAKSHLMAFFKEGIKAVSNEEENSFLFSISPNTAVLMHKNKYMHIQIFDTKKSKPMFVIKSLRDSENFSIHSFKNHGLTITNHLLHRYIQYFKKFILWKEKEIHKDTLERELMVKLKNGKTKFSSILTDTVYMVVDDTYFVLKINGKNTVSLVTMRPYHKILELPHQLRKRTNVKLYKTAYHCHVSKKSIFDENDIIKAQDDIIISKTEVNKRFTDFNFEEFKVYGKKYIQLLESLPSNYVGKNTFDHLFDTLIQYHKRIKERNVEEKVAICVDCNKEINDEKFYERLYNQEKIHINCAHNIIDFKNTGKVFLHSGLKGLYSTVKQREEQLKEKQEIS